jgi:hypothetical protein|tara:strand:- start:646 stop:1077 length:432 start_codon:yes stop_codon:yes gene_type:complete
MGQIGLTISLITIALFSIAVIGFGIGFANDNDAAFSIADDPELAQFNVQAKGNASGFIDDASNTYRSLINTTVNDESGVPTTTGTFAITPTNAVGTVTNVLKVGYTKIFGTGGGFGIFLTALISILAFMIALYIYKTFRGNPD